MLLLYFSLSVVIYHYLIYPIATVYLAQIKNFSNISLTTSLIDETELPTVTLIIAAYNEEKVIERKIANSLALEYPRGKLEIIIVSDGSTDLTPEIVKNYSAPALIGLHQPERQGKSAALNRAVEHASGEILVFSDANNDFNSRAILALTAPFHDPKIGGVNGVKRIYAETDRSAADGDGFYWIYESTLKQAESDLGSITGADGEIFAMRKSLYKPIEKTVINDDAAITFNIIKKGFRIIYEKDALSYESASIKLNEDFLVKQRMVAGGFQTVSKEFRYLLSHPSLFSFQFFSHKILRWLIPHFLIIILFCSLLNSDNTFAFALLALQLIAYSLVFLAWIIGPDSRLPRPVYFCYYFFLMNAAAFWGLFKYIQGQQTNLWSKAER